MVFLDMDGVLADFHKSAIYHLTGNKYLYDEIKHEYDIAKALNMSTTRFWQGLDSYDFWRWISPAPFCGELLYAFPDAVILSSPARGYSASGKLEWCRKFAKGHRVILTNHKELIAGPGRILIDDLESNINKWQANGGMGFLFPAPYNEAKDRSIEAFIELTKRATHEAQAVRND